MVVAGETDETGGDVHFRKVPLVIYCEGRGLARFHSSLFWGILYRFWMVMGNL